MVSDAGYSGGMNTWKVAVTCMRYIGGGEDEEEPSDDSYEAGETYMGEIDIPSNNFDTSDPRYGEAEDRQEEILDRYARDLYENYCIGFA